MSAQTLYDKLWNSHVVREEEDGTVLLYIDRHLVHEVTSPQAFEGLKMAGRKLWRSAQFIENELYIRLVTPLGSYWADRTLGSRLHELRRQKHLKRIEDYEIGRASCRERV